VQVVLEAPVPELAAALLLAALGPERGGWLEVPRYLAVGRTALLAGAVRLHLDLIHQA